MRPGEWRWHGTRVDGARFDLQGVVIYRIEGVRIVRGRLYMGDLPDYAYTKEEK
jgi:hypothetical protein